MRTPRIAVLVPVRNGERDLPDFLDSVGRFADLVVALDDGSTDATRTILEASPLVARVLANDRRATYAGWDDAENRRRLLRTLTDIPADWVLFLDADERLDPDDGAALQQFVRTEAIPGIAYGFLVVSMVGSDGTYDAGSGLWVYRMFANEPGLELPERRLHFVPVPTSIPRQRWVRTTLRIQHVGGSDPGRRDSRFRKYQEADPLLEFQDDYDRLLAEPTDVRPWTPRSPDTPVIATGAMRFASAIAELDRQDRRPTISAVVIAQNDQDTIAGSVGALVSQEIDQPFEVIVVTSGTDRTADVVTAGFPSVRVVRLPRPALPGEARNAGLWIASGHYVTFPGSHVTVAPGSLRARVAAHDAGWDLVTGTTLNGNHSTAGWASYFLDHSAVLPGRPPGELGAAPSHCSYVRDDLDLVGGFPEDMRAGEDTVVNQGLFWRGRRAFRASDAVIVHSSPCRSTAQLVRHHFGRGRAWGRILLERAPSRSELLRRHGGAVLRGPWRRIRLVSRDVRAWAGPLGAEYRRSWHLVIAGAFAAGLGTWYQILRGLPDTTQAGRISVPVGERSSAPPLLVAHAGSPLAPDLGILGRGPGPAAVRRIASHADRQGPGSAQPVVYLLALAATVTPGLDGLFAEPLADDVIVGYRTLAQAAGARMILGLQPVEETFRAALQRFERFLQAPGVGVALDPSWLRSGTVESSFGHPPWPGDDIDEGLDWLADVIPGGSGTTVLLHSSTDVEWPLDWRPRSRPGLDLIGLTDVAGPQAVTREALGRLAARAPSVGLQFRLRSGRDVPEPAEALREWPMLRIVVYR
jgi:glycosyltransferase involved in cell wall biosynthesis